MIRAKRVFGSADSPQTASAIFPLQFDSVTNTATVQNPTT